MTYCPWGGILYRFAPTFLFQFKLYFQLLDFLLEDIFHSLKEQKMLGKVKDFGSNRCYHSSTQGVKLSGVHNQPHPGQSRINTCPQKSCIRWGRNSDGRALAQHARGTGIDARRLQTCYNFVYTIYKNIVPHTQSLCQCPILDSNVVFKENIGYYYNL